MSETIQSISIFQLFRFATRYELMLDCIGLLAGIGAGSATPLMTLFFGNVIGSFVQIGQVKSDNGDNQPSLASIAQQFRSQAASDALHLVYLGVAMYIAIYICLSIWTYTGGSIAKRIREKYFQAVLHQEVSFLDTISAGEVATRIELDAHLFQQGVCEKFALVASNASSFVAGIVIAYVRSWRLALVLTSIIPAIVLVGALMTIISSRYLRGSLNCLSQGGGVAQESLSTIRTVHAFGAEAKLSALYDSFIALSRAFDLKASLVQSIGMSSFSFIVYSSYALSFYYGTTLLLREQADAGTIVTVGLSMLIGSFSLAMVGPNLQAVLRAREAAAQLYMVIDRVPTIDSISGTGRQLPDVDGGITFNDIEFAYPSRRDVPVLRSLNLVFPPGRTSALVGFSGSGKSTIIGLIERFYDPDHGSVCLDGVDVRDLNIKWLRSQIGLVEQDPVLFASSIQANVEEGLLGTPYQDASSSTRRDLVKRACVIANADSFITSLPLGYDTLVGHRGGRLSGGQKQRIALARAIVSDPKILLLDEATSALDAQSEEIVQSALAKASKGRTTIVIAHRLSTVRDADMIFVMGRGTVLQQGTHDDLLCDQTGPYAELVRAQRFAYNQTGHTEGDRAESSVTISLQEEKVPCDAKSQEHLPPPSGDNVHWTTLFRDIGVIISDTRTTYVWGTIFGCLGGLVYPAFGVVYAKTLQAFQESDPIILRTAGDSNALWLFLIGVGSAISLSLHNIFFGRAAAILTARLRVRVFQALLRENVTFFDDDANNPGILTANLVGHTEKINGVAAMTLGAILQCTSCCIGGAIVALIFGWKLALVGIACMPAIVALGLIRFQLVAAKEKAAKAAHEASAQIACEAAVSIRAIVSLTREDHTFSLYSNALQAPFKQSVKADVVINAAFAMSLSIIVFALALVFWYGSILVTSGEYTTFQFYVCFMCTIFGSWNASNVFMSVPDVSSAIDSARAIVPLLRSEDLPTHQRSTHITPTEKVQGGIRFEDVWFSYPMRPEVPVLRGFSMTVQPGTFAAFVGASGSGKSTVIQLIERFYEPTSGAIYFDGEVISGLKVDSYRRHVGLVSQDSKLYSGTIRYNILLGSATDVSDAEVYKACNLADILEFIESLPRGFETQIGEGGSQLSGGQKQRIAIARALVRNPKLLLLDEATSALDATSEIVVQKALNNASKGRTTIAIAHRLTSIQHADCIYFVRDGRVSEMGTHHQLIARGGDYCQLAKLQELEQ
ncbi:P-loop containing nucleoside triphosphate hydrolase protein [Leucogyrophana mollusca]|uniref:P-loop containing nucleoside triphosphate hydrolase protein n=1 Tax=Leucogyrophana mollusca TaxID=85980 RepID=A0ACB8B0T4_9AGAM|nr:P-loop containing nucleoside triphosphate hydrolase protein [Leucogyrophana mollusca]